MTFGRTPDADAGAAAASDGPDETAVLPRTGPARTGLLTGAEASAAEPTAVLGTTDVPDLDTGTAGPREATDATASAGTADRKTATGVAGWGGADAPTDTTAPMGAAAGKTAAGTTAPTGTAGGKAPVGAKRAAGVDLPTVVGWGSVTAPTGAVPGSPAAATGVLRDPWGGSLAGDAGQDATHDPHEVTVQLDAVQLGDTGLRPVEGAPSGGHDGSDGPVFVDASGRRSRRFRRLGMVIALACAVYAVVIVATLLSGSSDAPWLPVPGQDGDKPAGRVDSPPLPTESAPPSSSGSASPGATPTTGGGTTQAPVTGGGVPGTGTADGSPGTSADPKPSVTESTPGTGGSGTTSGKPKPPVTDPSAPVSNEPSTPVDTVPPPDPSGSPVGGGTGTGADTDSVAHGPSLKTPIAEEPGAAASSSSDLFPEHTL
ncbi:hypothetical protein AB0F77_26865 [Streptomyces sp. NPDC026672]|uniref:hypothetical protein n=1 Tax=unclassified Streptomyces TaxID=2593676 RepID=UPI0033E6CFF6